ncbi:MAG: hypothetical protein WC928_02245 [Patescibacteria group bacterium]|jgi:hypothetical protein
MKKFLTVRHFVDQNALRTYGHDGPLKPGQEDLISVTAKKVIAEINSSRVRAVKILYTTKTRRIKETANFIAMAIQDSVSVVFQHDIRLEVMDQGNLVLPSSYQDGEWFDPLDIAWDAICDEAYLNDNIFYQFGDSLNGKYPILATAFSRLGESLGSSLINKYSLIYDLAQGKFTKDDELLVIVAQSDLPLLIMELQALERMSSITSANLPYKSWEVYKSGLQEKMYDKNADGIGNFDIPMGYVGVFDLAGFTQSGLDITVRDAGYLLAQKITQH